MTTTKNTIETLQAQHYAARTECYTAREELAQLFETEARDEISEQDAEAQREALIAKADAADALCEELREAIHAALRPAAEEAHAAEVVRVRGINVQAIQVAADFGGDEFDGEHGTVRFGRSWIEGPRADIESFCLGAREMADDSFAAREADWAEMPASFAEVVTQRRQRALDRAIRKVLAQLV